MMKTIGKKGQAEIMDGLILMLIAATCAVVLLSISSSYGTIPREIYEETYSLKLAQNTLLSMYHITYLDDPSSPAYKKSIMVAVSRELSAGNANLRGSSEPSIIFLRDTLNSYHDELGRHFMFAITEEFVEIDESIIATDPRVTDKASFRQNVGHPSCASAALTYPNTIGCDIGGDAGNMCYAIFKICTWQA